MGLRQRFMETKRDLENQILELHKAGVGPLSISVRLAIPWKQVVHFLENQKRIPVETYDLNAKIYHSNEL